jgi:hypothetical protein
LNTEEDDEFKRIEMESGWRKRQIEQSEMCSNYGGFCKKQWVGLTDEELSEFDVDPVEAKAMIQRLKEKNT